MVVSRLIRFVMLLISKLFILRLSCIIIPFCHLLFEIETNFLKKCLKLATISTFKYKLNSNIKSPPKYYFCQSIIFVELELERFTMLDWEQTVALLTNICFQNILSTAPYVLALRSKMHNISYSHSTAITISEENCLTLSQLSANRHLTCYFLEIQNLLLNVFYAIRLTKAYTPHPPPRDLILTVSGRCFCCSLF